MDILGKTSRTIPQLEDVNSASNQWLDQLVTLMETVNNWPISLHPHLMQASACIKACNLVQAERAFLFLQDDPNQRLVLLAEADSGERLMVPYGRGIVGCLGRDGGTANVPRADQDPRYNSEFDHYPPDAPQPYSMLCVELKDTAGVPIAVLQVVNKKSAAGSRDPGRFSRQDETMLKLLGMQIAAVLRCCDMHARNCHSSEWRDPLSGPRREETEKNVRLVMDDLMTTPMACEEQALHLLASKVKILVQAEHCTAFVKDETETTVMWTGMQEQGGVWVRLTLDVSDQTTAGWCASRAQVLQVKNLALDPRFNRSLVSEQDMRAASGCSILCVPVVNSTEAEGSTMGLLGVIEVIKRAEFSELDREMLVSMSRSVPRLLDHVKKQRLRALLKECAADILKQTKRDEALKQFRQAVPRCLERDVHVRYFTLDAATNELVCSSRKPHTLADQQAMEDTELRGSIEMCGIEGYVAREGKPLRMQDAWGVTLPDGSSMSQTLDKHTGLDGIRDQATPLPLICVPVRRSEGEAASGADAAASKSVNKDGRQMQESKGSQDLGEVIGVVQILGVVPSPFTELQQKLVQELIESLQIVLHVCERAAEAAQREQDLVSLMRSLPELYSEYDMHRLLKIVAAEVCSLLSAHHCTTYMIDAATGEMWTRIDGFQREVRLPKGTGMVGAVASTAKTTYVADCMSSPQYGSILAEAGASTGVRSVLVVPVLSHAGLVLAVLQAFHALPNAFSEHQRGLLEEYARLVAVAIENQRFASRHVRDVQRGIPVEWEPPRVHASIRDSIVRLLACESAAVYQAATDAHTLFTYTPTPATARSDSGMSSSTRRDAFSDSASRDSHTASESVRRDVALHTGIVGRVYTCGDAVLTEAAHLLTDFDVQVDCASAKEARTLLCVPMYDRLGQKIGALLAVNKRRGKFSRDDETLLKLVASQWGEIISNNAKYSAAVATIESNTQLFKAARALESVTVARDLTEGLSDKLRAIVPCDKCAVFLVDADSQELVTYSPSGAEVRVPISRETVAGMAAETGDMVRVADAHADDRFQHFTQSTSHAHRADESVSSMRMLSCPVRDVRGTCVAVMQLIRAGAQSVMFTDRDEKLLRSVSEHVARSAVKTLTANKAARRLMDLMDMNVSIARDMYMQEGRLPRTIKAVVRKALGCDKVNVYMVDVMRRVRCRIFYTCLLVV
jgi:GAF domain-containing protein